MRRSPSYAFAFALVPVLALALLFPCARTSAQPKPINPACVSYCTLLLQDCFLQNGTDDDHCISVYRKCTAQCK